MGSLYFLVELGFVGFNLSLDLDEFLCGRSVLYLYLLDVLFQLLFQGFLDEFLPIGELIDKIVF